MKQVKRTWIRDVIINICCTQIAEMNDMLAEKIGRGESVVGSYYGLGDPQNGNEDSWGIYFCEPKGKK